MLRPPYVQLLDYERQYLKKLLSENKLAPRIKKRALALLILEEGKTYREVADELEVSYPSVFSWAKKYREEGLTFLKDKPRSGRPAVIGATEKEMIAKIAKRTPPKGHKKWTLRLLAAYLIKHRLVSEISHTKVGHILQEMEQ